MGGLDGGYFYDILCMQLAIPQAILDELAARVLQAHPPVSQGVSDRTFAAEAMQTWIGEA